MKDSDKGVIVFAIIFMVGITITAWAYTIIFNDAYAPSGRRWPTVTGMEVPVVFLVDENGYYATQSCTVTSFTADGITNMKCVDAPAVVQIGGK